MVLLRQLFTIAFVCEKNSERKSPEGQSIRLLLMTNTSTDGAY